MQSPKTKKTKRKFGINPAYYQTPITVVSAFFLGWVGEKLLAHLIYVCSFAFSVPSGLDWDTGWQALYDSGAPKMTVIVEGAAIFFFMALLWFITWWPARKTEERERIRDAKLDELPERIAEALLPILGILLGKQPICPKGCNIKQEGSNFCGQCGAKLIWR
jgi:hypothetical protein